MKVRRVIGGDWQVGTWAGVADHESVVSSLLPDAAASVILDIRVLELSLERRRQRQEWRACRSLDTAAECSSSFLLSVSPWSSAALL
jgi:hypothetical protein